MSRPVIDLKNQRFGKLVVFNNLGPRAWKGREETYWQCECDCGVKLEVEGRKLRTGHTKSCGSCGAAGAAYPVGNLVGRRFGLMTVLRQVLEVSKNTRRRWNSPRQFEVLCDCGQISKVYASRLVSATKVGSKKSCGRCGRWKPMVKRGLLTPIKFMRVENFKQVWLWKCDCGKSIERVDPGASGVKSCGCLAPKNKMYPTFRDAARSVYREYQRSARNRGYGFYLTEDEFFTLITSPCHYTGLLPSREIKTQEGIFRCGGVDRKNNEKHYTSDNVLPCSGFANMAKGTKTYEDFVGILQQITRFWNGKNQVGKDGNRPQTRNVSQDSGNNVPCDRDRLEEAKCESLNPQLSSTC